MSKKYNKNTDFVFVSIDKNRKNWDKATNQLMIPSQNYTIDDKTKEPLGLNKSLGIPYYSVLNKERKVVLRNSTVKNIQSFLVEQ